MLSLLTPLLLLLTTLLLHPFTSSAQKSSSPPPPNPLQQQQQTQQQQPLLSPKNTTTTPSPWHRLNNPIIKHLPSSSPSPKSFTLTASPATDLWRPNSHSNNFSAPFVYRICSVENFSRISVTVVPGKEFKSQWDQGGIAILFPDKDLWEKKRREEERLKLKQKKKGEEEGKGWGWGWRWMKNDNDKGEKHAKYSWIKTGLEWENGGLQLSTVATYAFSDWSLSPVVSSSKGGGVGGGVRFLVERNSSEFFPFFSLSHNVSIYTLSNPPIPPHRTHPPSNTPHLTTTT